MLDDSREQVESRTERPLGRRRFLSLTTLVVGGSALGGVDAVTAAPAVERVFGTPRWSSFRSILPTGDGYLLTGIRTSSAAEQVGWAVRLDDEFDVVWNRVYLSPPHLSETDRGEDHDGLEFALPDGDGGFLLVGWSYQESSESRFGWVTRVGGDGIPRWSRVYNRDDVNSFRDDFADGVVTDDGYLLVGRTIADEYDDEEHGDGWAVSIEPRRGRVRWQRAYDPAGPSEGWRDDERHSEFNAVTAIDDGYLVVGETSPDGPTEDTNTAAWALRIDEEGDPLEGGEWTDDGLTRRLTASRDNEFRDVVAVDDGYFVAGVAGRDQRVRELRDLEMRGRAWAVKFNSDGEVDWEDDPTGEAFHAVEPAGDGAVFVGRRDGRAWVVAYDGEGDRLGSYRSTVPDSGYTALTARRRGSRREFLPVGYGSRNGTTSGLGSRLTADELGIGEQHEDRLLEIVSTERGEVRYEFTVDGEVERARVSDRIKAEDDDRFRENDDGTVTVRGSTGNPGYGDAFRISGEVLEFESRGDAAFYLRLDGERVSVAELLGEEADRLLEIVATERGEVRYEFVVDGDVEGVRVSDRIKAEDDDRVRENDDGTVTVRGSTGNPGYGDAFRISGEIIAFRSSGDADFFVRLDGERVDPDDFGDGGSNRRLLEIVATERGEVRYEFTVDGDAEGVRVSDRIKAEDSDRIRENDNGTVTVRGTTGNPGYGDAFRITGDVLEFESSGDAAFYLRLDGERISVDELVED